MLVQKVIRQVINKRALEVKERGLKDELSKVHKQIEQWFFCYYCALELPKDFAGILDKLLEQEYDIAYKIYGDKAIKLKPKDIAYLPSTRQVEWWIMWGLSIYRL